MMVRATGRIPKKKRAAKARYLWWNPMFVEHASVRTSNMALLLFAVTNITGNVIAASHISKIRTLVAKAFGVLLKGNLTMYHL